MKSLFNKAAQKSLDIATTATGIAAGGTAGFIYQAATASLFTKAIVAIGFASFPVVSIPVALGAVGVGALSAGAVISKNKLVISNQKSREDGIAIGFCDGPAKNKSR